MQLSEQLSCAARDIARSRFKIVSTGTVIALVTIVATVGGGFWTLGWNRKRERVERKVEDIRNPLIHLEHFIDDHLRQQSRPDPVRIRRAREFCQEARDAAHEFEAGHGSRGIRLRALVIAETDAAGDFLSDLELARSKRPGRVNDEVYVAYAAARAHRQDNLPSNARSSRLRGIRPVRSV